MNPQSAGRKPNQANVYREQYVASLMLDISNINKNLNANRGMAVKGSSGAPPVDGRTITEKYADTDALKVMLRGQLREITDGQQANDIVYELTTNELEFLAGHIPFVIADLKPKWKLGIPAEAFVPYLRKLMRKNVETEGVEYGLQEGGGGAGGGPGGGLPPPTINNIPPVGVWQEFADDILAVPDFGDLESVDDDYDDYSIASSLAPSEASSQYSLQPNNFGFLGAAPPRPPLRSIVPRPVGLVSDATIRMRDMIHRDMLRIIDSYPSAEDAAIIQLCPDPFIQEAYQTAVAEFADTLPNLQQMESYRDDLETAIVFRNEREGRAIIKEWSAIVSAVDYQRMEDAKAIVVEAQRVSAEAEGAPPLYEEPGALDMSDLDNYFAQLQAAPRSVASFLAADEEQQSLAPPTVLGSIEEDISVMTEVPPAPEGSIPLLSYMDFRRLPNDEIKRQYLTVVVEILPESQEFFREWADTLNDMEAETINIVFPNDELAEGGDIEDVEEAYGLILESSFIGMRVGEVIVDEPDEIAALPPAMVDAVSPEKLPPLDPLLTRAEFAQRSAEKGGITPQGVADIELTTSPQRYTEGDLTPSAETVNQYRFASAAEQAAEDQRLYGPGGNPYRGATAADYQPGGRFAPTSGNGISGCGKCRGRGMSCCDRCSKKMKAGKLPIGKGKNIIIGRGLMPARVTAKVVPSNIDLSLGVKAEPAYVSFGKHLINKHRLLKDDVLMLRTMKGGAITAVPTQKISRGLSKVLRTIIGGGAPDFDSLSILSDNDKEVLYNISKTSRISHSVPNPNKTAQEQEDTRFELLKGQIASGQDNKEAVKEFKLLLVKMMNQKRIPKGQGIDILTEMAAMGL